MVYLDLKQTWRGGSDLKGELLMGGKTVKLLWELWPQDDRMTWADRSLSMASHLFQNPCKQSKHIRMYVKLLQGMVYLPPHKKKYHTCGRNCCLQRRKWLSTRTSSSQTRCGSCLGSHRMHNFFIQQPHSRMAALWKASLPSDFLLARRKMCFDRLGEDKRLL